MHACGKVTSHAIEETADFQCTATLFAVRIAIPVSNSSVPIITRAISVEGVRDDRPI
jgi:hypothetical protein